VAGRGVDAGDLKVPSWMLRPDAAAMRIAPLATLDVAALRALVMLARTTAVATGAKNVARPYRPSSA
jgi:hypothetical protein